ncbi:hypothetical protein GCM10020229_27860 [Kitasatospora albolonga]|uniref:hypothetical protein n=1 Tax=Kitasatospora albolonga TaxID=68173 RepID=UPI0031ECAAA1
MPKLLRFFFEYGVSTPLWPESGTPEALDGPVEPEELPVEDGLRAELSELSELYQSSLDWNDPGGPSLWSEEQWAAFHPRATAALAELRRQLGDGFAVRDCRLDLLA